MAPSRPVRRWCPRVGGGVLWRGQARFRAGVLRSRRGHRLASVGGGDRLSRLLGGLRPWPGVLAADLLANDYALLPLGSALGWTAGNMAEVIVGALLIRRLAARGSPLDSLGGIARLLAAIAAATVISATVGPLSLRAGGVVSGSELPEVIRTWWLGDATGALIVIPLALAWYRPLPRDWARGACGGGSADACRRCRHEPDRVHHRSPARLSRLRSLGWAALRFGKPRCDPGDHRGGGLCDLADHALPRAVRL